MRPPNWKLIIRFLWPFRAAGRRKPSDFLNILCLGNKRRARRCTFLLAERPKGLGIYLLFLVAQESHRPANLAGVQLPTIPGGGHRSTGCRIVCQKAAKYSHIDWSFDLGTHSWKEFKEVKLRVSEGFGALELESWVQHRNIFCFPTENSAAGRPTAATGHSPLIGHRRSANCAAGRPPRTRRMEIIR